MTKGANPTDGAKTLSMRPIRLVLASGSQARLRVLQLAGIDPEVVVSGVDESTDGLDTPGAVAVLAERKASAVVRMRGGCLVLGCDSLLDLDGDSARQARVARGGDRVLGAPHGARSHVVHGALPGGRLWQGRRARQAPG